jgi:Ca2+-binding EF-hand superfamily protein
MLRDFSSIDTVDSGYASRAETRYVLGKYNVSLSDQHLTSLIPTNRNGLIEYRKFLISFGKLRTVDAITFSYLILFLHYLANSY